VLALSLGLAVAPPLVLRCIQMAGALVLAWIGFKALLSRPPPKSETAAAAAETTVTRKRERGQAAMGFMEGFLCNVTNVKVFVFFVSLFSQFIRPDSSLGWHVLVPVILVIHGAVMWTLVNWALMFPPVARQLARMQQWLPRVFGVILIAFAIFVAYESLAGLIF